MAGPREESELKDAAREVQRIRTGVLLVGWTVEALSEGCLSPEDEGQRMELNEGMRLFLDLLARELATVYGKLNED